MKSKSAAVVGSVLFFIVMPGTVAGLVPWLITRWHAEQTPFAPLLLVLGSVAVAAGLAILIESFARFALQGIGTPAPTHPTLHLETEGTDRYVRNPMYVAVLAIITGQAALFADARLLAYGILVWLLCRLVVLTVRGASAAPNPWLRIRQLSQEYSEMDPVVAAAFATHTSLTVAAASRYRASQLASARFPHATR